jgi:hypothetical protein
MRIINFSVVFIAFALQIAGFNSSAIGAPVSKSDKVTQFFEGDDGIQPNHYRIDSRAFSEEDAKVKLGFLKKQGFNWTETATEGDQVSFKDTVKKQWLTYNPEHSRYLYYDNAPVGPTDDIVDIKKLRSKADEYVAEILGDSVKSFKYKNGEYEYQVIRGTPRRLVSITFRYVRLLDGREVLGTTNHLRIKLTNNGTVRLLDYSNPVLVKTQEISSKIKRKSFGKYLDLYLKSNAFTKTKDGESIPIKNIEVNDASSSYFAEETGEKQYLTPYTSFFSLIVTDKGDTAKREFHMKDDPESVPGIQNEDIVHYRTHIK